MTRENIMEMVNLALSKGKIDRVHIYISPNDERPCGLFNENEVDEIRDEYKNSYSTGKSHYFGSKYHMDLGDNHIFLSFQYKLNNESKITEIEKQLAQLQAKKEKLENGETEEVC